VVRATGQGLSHEYFLNDHLGSTRVVFNGNGVVLQATDYYAFGLEHTPKAKENENRYLYNGKELQDETFAGGVRLGWYDYGWRMYDPQIGRWHVQDPLAEKHFDMSSYNYCLNNPMLFVDPIGLDTFNVNIENRTIDRVAVKDSKNHVYIVKNGDELLSTTTMEISKDGLVKFPDSGEGYGRFGQEDEGGDHYLNPETAASLLGLTSEMKEDDDNFQVNFNDMSDAKGGAPGGDHKTHGGSKGYSGDCIDYEYLGKDNKSYYGVSTDNNFAPVNNYLFLQKAEGWGFTKNYISNKNVWNYGPYVKMSPNGKLIDFHDNHGHLTYIKKP